MAESLYVLFEHAAGYTVFKVQEFEEVGMLLPQVEASTTDLGRFKQVVKLVSFLPFKSAVVALENMNSVSEGIITEQLQLFLERNLPKPSKKERITLGVSDHKLGAAITEAVGINCTHIGAVPEIIRGIRLHFHNLVKGFTSESSGVAQLGLGHSYSRAKVKFNVNRVDNMVIQSIALLDQLDKDINTFAMRIREWYSYHFPELYQIVPDNYTYARAAAFVKNRKDLTDAHLESLEEIVMDSGKAQDILKASKSSMGMDIAAPDLINIEMFANRVVSLSDYRKQLSEYLCNKMANIAPNLREVIGDLVGARLIAHAGSLTNLAKYPASTVQILGAEKALFRALKLGCNTPKYGLIFHSTFIGRAQKQNKGRISRFLANKCSIASRIDCFSDQPSSVFGIYLRKQVEDRLIFYEKGEKPAKNIDVMTAASVKAAEVAQQLSTKEKKKKKKKKNQSLENGPVQANGMDVDEVIFEGGEEPKKKKKKKKRKSEGNADASMVVENENAVDSEPAKKKKKLHANDSTNVAEEKGKPVNVIAGGDAESPKKKKKKKKKSESDE